MIEQDTIKLLRECDSGIKMGMASIDEVYKFASSKKLKSALNKCKGAHERLNEEMQGMLASYGDSGKNPNIMIKGMSWLKTNMKLSLNESDSTIAGLMIDGCNMGVKSLSKYLNEYKAAEEKSKDIAKKLIAEEDQLSKEMREFL